MLEALDPAWLPTNIDTVRVQLDPHEMSGEVLHRTSHAAVRQAQPRWRSARVPPDGGEVGQGRSIPELLCPDGHRSGRRRIAVGSSPSRPSSKSERATVDTVVAKVKTKASSENGVW